MVRFIESEGSQAPLTSPYLNFLHEYEMVKNEILIVDDSKINREMLRLILEDEYDIVEASNGQEAIDIIEKGDHVFRLVLLDLVMPVLNGYETLQEFNKRGWQHKLPVIIISGDSTDEALSRAYDLGAADFFAKPYNPQIVLRRVMNVIASREYSYRDLLTGAYNRSGFLQMANNFLQKCEDRTKYAVMFFDVKNFKAINSVLGTEGGDAVLKQTYRGMSGAGLEPIFVSRFEADHFVCLVEADKIDIDAMMHENNQVLDWTGRSMQFRFRTGISYIDSDGDVINFVDRAKLSLSYIEDEYLKPYAIFDDKMANNYINAASVTSEFDTSMANEEFKVYYQPIMEAATGKIASAEALIRWIHPVRGFVRPDLFIPVLEKDGFISKLDLFVDRKVNQIMRRWHDQGLPTVPVSVNLSWMDFYDQDMIQNILDHVAQRVTAPGSVRYEITESSFAALKENRGDVLSALREQGAWLLMDDFGSGYSSLGMLMHYKFDILKIDMSFVRQLENNPDVKHIVKMIIDMCHLLGMKVVAEGAETETQVNILREDNCDYIQGYYFSKPLPEEDFKQFLAKCKAEGKI